MSETEQDKLEIENEEEIVRRQRKEKKDLQAKIQALKKSIAKGDKKKKKTVTEEIAKLEADLNSKHEEELNNLKNQESSNVVIQNGIQESEASPEEPAAVHKVSKAQKRRDKKANKEKAREAAIAEAEEENKKGVRYIEYQKIKEYLKSRKLSVKEIPADGSCLYFAVMDQLRQQGTETSVEDLRQLTANYIRSNKDEFIPFLCDQDTGDPFTDEQFSDYCNKIANTSAWGGQMEIRAMSHILGKVVEVIQSETAPLLIGEEYINDKEGRLVITYHKHAFRVGEHYNSVEPLEEDAT